MLKGTEQRGEGENAMEEMRDFVLVIAEVPTGGYTVALKGNAYWPDIGPFPFASAEEMEALSQHANRAREFVYEHDRAPRGGRPVPLPRPEGDTGLKRGLSAWQTLGAKLAERLFHGVIYDHYKRVEKDKGYQIRLRLLVPSTLDGIPWEMVATPDGERFLQGPRKHVVRWTDAERAYTVTESTRLRVLALGAAPEALQPLNLGAEQEALRKVLDLHWIENGSMDDLKTQLRERTWDVFHFAGHGEGGAVFARARDGTAERVLPEELASVLQERGVRLVVLNSCHGASGGTADALDKEPSVARALSECGVPAVVAMRSEISDGDAIDFTRAFSQALALHRTITEAVTDARDKLRRKGSDAWAIPVLYLNGPDERLIERPLPQQSDDAQRSEEGTRGKIRDLSPLEKHAKELVGEVTSPTSPEALPAYLRVIAQESDVEGPNSLQELILWISVKRCTARLYKKLTSRIPLNFLENRAVEACIALILEGLRRDVEANKDEFSFAALEKYRVGLGELKGAMACAPKTDFERLLNEAPRSLTEPEDRQDLCKQYDDLVQILPKTLRSSMPGSMQLLPPLNGAEFDRSFDRYLQKDAALETHAQRNQRAQCVPLLIVHGASDQGGAQFANWLGATLDAETVSVESICSATVEQRVASVKEALADIKVYSESTPEASGSDPTAARPRKLHAPPKPVLVVHTWKTRRDAGACSPTTHPSIEAFRGYLKHFWEGAWEGRGQCPWTLLVQVDCGHLNCEAAWVEGLKGVKGIGEPKFLHLCSPTEGEIAQWLGYFLTKGDRERAKAAAAELLTSDKRGMTYTQVLEQAASVDFVAAHLIAPRPPATPTSFRLLRPIDVAAAAAMACALPWHENTVVMGIALVTVALLWNLSAQIRGGT